MPSMRLLCCFFALLIMPGGNIHAAGDASRGARAFAQCMACHSVRPGEHMTGPSLAHVWNHKAGSAEGFMRYSEAIKEKDFVWTPEALDQWLRDPAAFLPGTSMTFPGIRNAQVRQDIIAYLQSVSENKAPPQAGRAGMSGMRRERPNLREAPPEGRVTSLKHCGDSYAVATADGKNQKVWEFNLRFKTDSSELGPAPGKPVVLGAGMQGDRASVVFAQPAEISRFVEESCPL